MANTIFYAPMPVCVPNLTDLWQKNEDSSKEDIIIMEVFSVWRPPNILCTIVNLCTNFDQAVTKNEDSSKEVICVKEVFRFDVNYSSDKCSGPYVPNFI